MIEIPESYNYISAFLTFKCNFHCSYCVNKYNGLYSYGSMKASEWIEGLNRIKTRPDLPITFSGGEPTLYKNFDSTIFFLNKVLPIDLLTNGEFDIARFMKIIKPDRLKRDSPYASIRFSYHPGYSSAINLLSKVFQLKREGYSVGIWAVDRTPIRNRIIKLLANVLGIDFTIKEFLDKKHGHYKYPAGLDSVPKKCLCKPSELLIAPDGRLFRCHYDLYHGVNSYGHILDSNLKLPEDFMPCSNYGLCNPCDLKLKYDRFQVDGHCAVEIKNG